MKLFLNRIVATVLLLFLFVMLCFPGVAVAKPTSDNGEMTWGARITSVLRGKTKPPVTPGQALKASSKPSVANPTGSQPRPGEDVREFRGRTGRGSDGERDRERREMVKEVTGKSHVGRGGPQDP